MNNNETKKYTFHVHGMHCNACVLLTESEIRNLPGVTSAKSSLKNHSIEVTGDFGNKTPEEIAKDLTVPIAPHGYSVEIEKQTKQIAWSEFKIATPIALLFIFIFIALQRMGIVNMISGENVNYSTAFIIGIIASLSTCMAVVGGLVLSVSANYDKQENPTSSRLRRARPQTLFHLGRLVSFFILGGVIGFAGKAFTLNIWGTFILNILVGAVMFILGLNLLDIFPWAKKLQPSMPKFLSTRAHGLSKLNHTLTPLLLGTATFFLPCGFTQSMQLYTLSSGGFLPGSLTMFFFALGTLPVLALLSFSSLSIQRNKNRGIFFKSAGLVVILFALFNLINSLVILGLIPPVFNF